LEEVLERPRVVITGIGTINPLGNSVTSFWDSLSAGESGIGNITLFDPQDLPCKIAGEVKDFDPHKFIERKEARRIPRSAQIAIAAAQEAVQDSGLELPLTNQERTGVCFATAVGGVDEIVESSHVQRYKNLKNIGPYRVPNGIPNIPAFMIARDYQCLGPNLTITTACAAGTQAVGEGAELIRRGSADIVITGGTEAIVTDLVIGAFTLMRAIPFNYNDNPQAASRPFDLNREGFVLSEGASVLVLEEMGNALARGAKIYAEVAGHASSSDAFHMAALKPDGLGPARAIRWALADAAINVEDVDYINAHGTSTPLNDKTETLAIKQVFGEHAYELAVSSTKSMIGHSMGSAGATEAVACVLAMNNNFIPPTINYDTPDPECDLDYVPNKGRASDVDIAISNSFGLGGQNACLVLRKFNG
jgi:beta-ketoacyl-acyl-carrier-protein synthase II